VQQWSVGLLLNIYRLPLFYPYFHLLFFIAISISSTSMLPLPFPILMLLLSIPFFTDFFVSTENSLELLHSFMNTNVVHSDPTYMLLTT